MNRLLIIILSLFAFNSPLYGDNLKKAHDWIWPEREETHSANPKGSPVPRRLRGFNKVMKKIRKAIENSTQKKAIPVYTSHHISDLGNNDKLEKFLLSTYETWSQGYKLTTFDEFVLRNSHHYSPDDEITEALKMDLKAALYRVSMENYTPQIQGRAEVIDLSTRSRISGGNHTPASQNEAFNLFIEKMKNIKNTEIHHDELDQILINPHFRLPPSETRNGQYFRGIIFDYIIGIYVEEFDDFIKKKNLIQKAIFRWWDDGKFRDRIFPEIENFHLMGNKELLLKWWEEAIAKGQNYRLEWFIEDSFNLSLETGKPLSKNPFIKTLLKASRENDSLANAVSSFMLSIEPRYR